MSLLNILFQETKAKIDSVTLDASVSEEHTRHAEVTESPVEEGAAVTDHVQLKPVELSIDGVITDTPVDFRVLNKFMQGDIKGGISGLKDSFVSPERAALARVPSAKQSARSICTTSSWSYRKSASRSRSSPVSRFMTT